MSNKSIYKIFSSPEKSGIELLGLVATSVQEVTSDSMNRSATLDALLMELKVRYKLKYSSYLHTYWLLQQQSKENILSYNSLVAASRLALSKGQAQLNEIRLEVSNIPHQCKVYHVIVSTHVCSLCYLPSHL